MFATPSFTAYNNYARNGISKQESLSHPEASARPDAAACKSLYLDGILNGKIADNDTGYDIDDIESAYMKYPGNHTWGVAILDDGRQVIGMVGVQRCTTKASVKFAARRVAVPFAGLRDRRRPYGNQVLQFCQKKLYLKVKLDTYWDQTAAVQLFEKFRFHHDHTKTMGEKALMYFYFDPYSRGQNSQE